MPLLRGGGGEPRTVFAMRFREWTEPNLVLKAAIDARWKYIVSTSGAQEKFKLFDLDHDSEEHTDIVEAQPQVAEALGRRLGSFEAEAEVFRRAFADGFVLTPKRREELERLGYVE